MSPQAVTPLPRAGPSIPDYELLCPIGHGAYGEVWLARNVTGSWVALKIVHRSAFDHERPFEREFEGIKRFEPISRSDSCQVAILHVGLGEGFFYYVMELADDVAGWGNGVMESRSDGSTTGQHHSTTPSLQHSIAPASYAPKTLKRLLNDRGVLPADECLAITLSLTRALAHLHGHGLVHRDVKPSNVIFVNGVAKLADIGLVTSVDATRSFVGTEGYLPPEGAGTPQADLYSLGKVLYEMSTGCDRKEFPALPPNIATRPDRDALADLNAIVVRACQLDPRERYASAEAMRADLELLQRGRSVRRKRAWGYRWAVAKRALATAGVLAVLVTGGFLLWQQAPVTRPLSANPEALRLYHEARYFMKSDTVDRRLQAYTNLVEAVKLDPGFVDAHYEMFEVYFDSYVGDKLPPHFNQLANFRAVVENLRQVSPDSAQYHTANSTVKEIDWQFDEGIDEAALAINLDPKFLRAHMAYARYMCFVRGDAETALRELKIAEQIDYTDVLVQINMAVPFLIERKFDLAIKQYSKAMHLEDRTTQLYLNLASAYEADKQYDKALDYYKQFDLSNGDDPATTKEWYEKLRSELGEKGPRGWWQAELDRERNRPAPNHYRMAELSARLGHTNEIFPLLNQAFDNHNGWMMFLLVSDCFDPLHDDPQFQELVKKMGLRPKRKS